MLEEGVVGVIEAAGRGCGEGGEGEKGLAEVSMGGFEKDGIYAGRKLLIGVGFEMRGGRTFGNETILIRISNERNIATYSSILFLPARFSSTSLHTPACRSCSFAFISRSFSCASAASRSYSLLLVVLVTGLRASPNGCTEGGCTADCGTDLSRWW